MWPTLLYAALAIAICGWIFTSFRQRRKVHALERSKEEIQVEETLVFDFLHGLGEAFRETIKPHDLHRLIVEGATRILDAHGGALYLTDRSGNKLVPVFLSKGCPPLVPVPGHILHQAATAPAALEGFLRMHSVPPGEGLIGTRLADGATRFAGRCARRTGIGALARNTSRDRLADGHAVALWQAKHGRARGWQRPDGRAIHAE